ncbi:TonB-dependent receptor domain-containing protein [Asticcacaulis endophyticus]|uniref:Exogenous ferric siderophore receptor n=1 Tax=Asticcacaulis endophyticus TaxID=1395890 RepID=A0A918QC43_9CAUL|nr:TonB-dependent receptor [Asticcacaulis endophyticus]GGZ39692.1 exogenous ferric siderophore receptor [Asticcacaulis endophyticus]
MKITGIKSLSIHLLTSTALILGLAAVPAHAQPVDAAEEERVTEVVVTASGFKQNIEQAPASISVLSRKELEQERHQSLAEALANVEGVDVGDTAGKTGGLNINIRGMGSEYSLILIDGRRQNAAGSITPNGFGETSSSFIPPMSAIDRIEVVRGPVSTLYGSDAMGGVVNIITRKVGKIWQGSATAGATLQADDSFGNIYNGNFYANGPLVQDKLGLAVRGSYQTREESSLTYENINGGTAIVSTRGPSPVENEIWSAGARLSFTPTENHDLMFDYDINKQWYDNSVAQLGTIGTSGYAPEQEFNNEEMVLSHNWRLGFGELQTTLSRGVRETIGRILPSDVPGGGNAGDPRTLEATNSIFDTKLFSQWRNHTFTVGGQYWDAEMVDGVAPAPYEHQQWALFAEDEWRLMPTLALTLGVRADDHSVFGKHTSPRAYLVWNTTPNWTLKGGVSQGFKTPQLNQIAPGITGFTGQGTRPTIGSPGLKPETSTSTEFAVFYDNRSDFRANVTVFHNKFEDKIATGDPLDNCSFAVSPNRPGCVDYGIWPLVDTFAQSVNVDEAETQGVEGAFRYLIAEGWSLTGNYTYTDTEQKSGSAKGRPLNNTPAHMINGSVRWNASDKLNLWLRGEYRSERYRSEDSTTSTAKRTFGDYKPYGIFHTGGSYKVTDKVTVNAVIYNIFDKDFVSYGGYVSNTNTGAISYTNLYSNNQEPRRLWLSITTEF